MRQLNRTGFWLPELFNDLMNLDVPVRTRNTAPAVNVMESNTGYTVEVAAPGLKKEDFTVHIDDDGNLSIKMEQKKNENVEEKDVHYLRREFSYSKYEQTLVLPDDVDKEKISAKVCDGILTVELPKLEARVMNPSRQIAID